MTEHWFVSDYHFHHRSLRERYRSHWDSNEEMNEALIENTNALVKRNDFLYFMGDFTWRKYGLNILKRLNGQIFFIYGNHDKRNIINKLKNYKNVVWHGEQKGIEAYNQKIFLNHYPMFSWSCSHWGAWQIHGHSHSDVSDITMRIGKIMNVCIDVIDYRPINFGQVQTYMERRLDNWNLAESMKKNKK